MLLVEAHAIEMAQRVDLWRLVAVRGIFTQVVHHRARRAERLRVTIQPKAGEFGDAKLFTQQPLGIVVLKDPLVQPRLDAARAFEQRSFGGLEKLLRARQQRLARPQQLQFVAHGLHGSGANKFGGLKLAGRKVDVRDADGRSARVAGHRGEKIIFFNI